MKKRIIIVSNRLPVSVAEESGKITLQRSNGGVATAMSSAMDSGDQDALWVGWSGSNRHISRRRLMRAGWDKRLLPVHLKADTLDRYYARMSNAVFWPMLHGLPATIAYESADWKAYVSANRTFAKKLLTVIKPHDVIWIHDYHLMLLPQLLREAGVVNRIGFFLHVPFASPDCLEGLTEHRAIMQSLAQVDVMGLQTERDAANFRTELDALGLAVRPGSVIRPFPIGVDFDAYRVAEHKPAVRQAGRVIAGQIKGKRVVLSVSRLDYTKGIPEQLLAYEQLLETSDRPEGFYYKLIVAPSREDAAGYTELKKRIEQEVRRINSRFGTAGYVPIDYTYRSCGFDELNAWYRVAEILLVTPIIDGMNLVAKEYIAARHDDQGVVVLSNTIGAAQQLRTAVQVDPHDVAAIAAALQQALVMPPQERALRWLQLRNNVQYQDVFWWLHDFLAVLQSRAQAVLFSQEVHTPRMRLGRRLETLGARLGAVHGLFPRPALPNIKIRPKYAQDEDAYL